MSLSSLHIPRSLWILLTLSFSLTSCVTLPPEGVAPSQKAATAQPQPSETRVFEYEDDEGCSHVISLSINDQSASGKVAKLNPASPGGGAAKFSGRVLQGSGPGQVRLEVTIQPGGYHNVDCHAGGKCAWVLQGDQLKVPLSLPIGRTGYRDVITFHAQSYN